MSGMPDDEHLEEALLAAARESWVRVPRELLVRIDSVCSLVAHRGLDIEASFELERVAREVRRLYEEKR